MTESITSSTLFNSFAVFREIMKGITALSTLHSNFSKENFYFEDFPNLKATGTFFSGIPFVLVETEMDTNSLTIKDKKQMMYTTVVSIYVDHFVEQDKVKLNSYLNAIANYINANKQTLRWTYGLFNVSISKEREIEVISQKKFVIGKLTFDYNVTLNTGS